MTIKPVWDYINKDLWEGKLLHPEVCTVEEKAKQIFNENWLTNWVLRIIGFFTGNNNDAKIRGQAEDYFANRKVENLGTLLNRLNTVRKLEPNINSLQGFSSVLDQAYNKLQVFTRPDEVDLKQLYSREEIELAFSYPKKFALVKGTISTHQEWEKFKNGLKSDSSAKNLDDPSLFLQIRKNPNVTLGDLSNSNKLNKLKAKQDHIDKVEKLASEIEQKVRNSPAQRMDWVVWEALSSFRVSIDPTEKDGNSFIYPFTHNQSNGFVKIEIQDGKPFCVVNLPEDIVSSDARA